MEASGREAASGPAGAALPDEERRQAEDRPGDLELADVVARLRRAMRRAWRAADAGNPLSVAQLELLTSLQENPGARPGQLARALRLAPNSVTTLVNGLQRHGLVTRAEGGSDRRAVRLTLTTAGEEAARRWQTTNAAILRDALAGMSEAGRATLGTLVPALRELVGAIDRTTDPSPGSP